MRNAKRTDVINLRIELDPQTAIDLANWATEEERSKRQLAKVIIRKNIKQWKEAKARQQQGAA